MAINPSLTTSILLLQLLQQTRENVILPFAGVRLNAKLIRFLGSSEWRKLTLSRNFTTMNRTPPHNLIDGSAAQDGRQRLSNSSWCCVASFNEIQKEASVMKMPVELEMSDWMSTLEQNENRMDDPAGAGAYDTWRCDRLIKTTCDSSSQRWIEWGADFHLQRLTKSFSSVVTQREDTAYVSHHLDAAVSKALEQSRCIVDAFLKEADLSLSQQTKSLENHSNNADSLIQIVRVTLLWSTPINNRNHCNNSDYQIMVRGHAYSSGQVLQVHQPSTPIIVTIAAYHHHHHHHHHHEAHLTGHLSTVSEEEFGTDTSIPSRLDANPEIKVAKWTRLRKQIPQPEGVGEVLLVKRHSSNGKLELLEGLSSNVFCIYSNNTIRTATHGVLFGYVRHLVLESLDECGLTWDPTPIWLDRSSQHELPWKEVFITSSSRLIYPVSKVLCQEDDGTYQEYWSARRCGDEEIDPDNSTGSATTEAGSSECPKWQLLLQAILRKGGYSP